MARLAMCGWESGSTEEVGVLSSATGTGPNHHSIESTARSGSYALKLGTVAYNNTTTAWAFRAIPLPGTPAEIYLRVGVGYFLAQAMGGSLGASDNVFLDLMDGIVPHLRLRVNNSGSIDAVRYNVSLGGVGTMPSTGFICIEMHALIHGTNGRCRVWIDGLLVFDFTGNTLGTGGAARITDVHVGLKRYNTGSGGGDIRHWLLYDDLAVNDTTGTVNNGRIGQGGIIAMHPSADTAEKDWSRSAGSDNFALVDDVPCDGDTTYISAVDSGALDLYEHGDLALGGTIDAVQVVLATRIASGSGRFVAPTLRSGAATSVGSTFSAINTYGFSAQIWGADPNTAVPWSVAAVNSLQAGVTLTN